LDEDIEIPQDLTEDTEEETPPEEVNFESQQQMDNSQSDSVIVESENHKPRARQKLMRSNSHTGKSYEVLVPKNPVQTKSKLLQTKKSLSIPPPPLRYRDGKGGRGPATKVKSDSSVATVTKSPSIRNQTRPQKAPSNIRANQKPLEKAKPLPTNPSGKSIKEINRTKSKTIVSNASRAPSKDTVPNKSESNKLGRQSTTVKDTNSNSNWAEPCDSNVRNNDSHNSCELHNGSRHMEQGHYDTTGYGQQTQHLNSNPSYHHHNPPQELAYRQTQRNISIESPEDSRYRASRQYVPPPPIQHMPGFPVDVNNRQAYLYMGAPHQNQIGAAQPIVQQQPYQNLSPGIPPGYIAVHWPARPPPMERNVQQVYHQQMSLMHQPKQYGAALVVDANTMKNYFDRGPPGPPLMPPPELDRRYSMNHSSSGHMQHISNHNVYPMRRENSLSEPAEEDSSEEVLESCNDAEVDIAFTDAEAILPPPEYKESSSTNWRSRDALPNPPTSFQDSRPSNPKNNEASQSPLNSARATIIHEEGANNGQQQYEYYNAPRSQDNYSPRQRELPGKNNNFSPRVPPPAPAPYNNSNGYNNTGVSRDSPRNHQSADTNHYTSTSNRVYYDPPKQRNVAIQMGRRATDETAEIRASAEPCQQRGSEHSQASSSYFPNSGQQNGGNDEPISSNRRQEEASTQKTNSTPTVHRRTSNASTQISQRAQKQSSHRARVVNYNNSLYGNGRPDQVNNYSMHPNDPNANPHNNTSYNMLNEYSPRHSVRGAPLSVITIRAPVPLSLQDPMINSSRSQVDDLGSIPPPSGFRESQCALKLMDSSMSGEPISYSNANNYVNNDNLNDESANNGGYYQ